MAVLLEMWHGGSAIACVAVPRRPERRAAQMHACVRDSAAAAPLQTHTLLQHISRCSTQAGASSMCPTRIEASNRCPANGPCRRRGVDADMAY